jgi:hypothetical protein
MQFFKKSLLILEVFLHVFIARSDPTASKTAGCHVALVTTVGQDEPVWGVVTWSDIAKGASIRTLPQTRGLTLDKLIAFQPCLQSPEVLSAYSASNVSDFSILNPFRGQEAAIVMQGLNYKYACKIFFRSVSPLSLVISLLAIFSQDTHYRNRYCWKFI